jgi:hypothetical protein
MGAHGKKGDHPIYFNDFHHYPVWFEQNIAFDHIPSRKMVGVQEPGFGLQ